MNGEEEQKRNNAYSVVKKWSIHMLLKFNRFSCLPATKHVVISTFSWSGRLAPKIWEIYFYNAAKGFSPFYKACYEAILSCRPRGGKFRTWGFWNSGFSLRIMPERSSEIENLRFSRSEKKSPSSHCQYSPAAKGANLAKIPPKLFMTDYDRGRPL